MKDNSNTARKIISITGTPAAGKTALAEKLAKALNAEVIDLTEIINKNKLYSGIDKERDAKIIDTEKLKKFIDNLIETKFKGSKTIVIEGLLSQFMFATHIIVLRTNPKVLKQRLKLRNYSRMKIKENLEAEFLGICLEESLWCNNILEIDASESLNLDLILEWLKKGGKNIKEIDWTEDFCKVLSEL